MVGVASLSQALSTQGCGMFMTGHITFTTAGCLKEVAQADHEISNRSRDFVWLRGGTNCLTTRRHVPVFTRLFDCLPVRILELRLHHRVLSKEIYQIRDYGFGVLLPSNPHRTSHQQTKKDLQGSNFSFGVTLIWFLTLAGRHGSFARSKLQQNNLNTIHWVYQCWSMTTVWMHKGPSGKRQHLRGKKGSVFVCGWASSLSILPVSEEREKLYLFENSLGLKHHSVVHCYLCCGALACFFNVASQKLYKLICVSYFGGHMLTIKSSTGTLLSLRDRQSHLCGESLCQTLVSLGFSCKRSSCSGLNK